MVDRKMLLGLKIITKKFSKAKYLMRKSRRRDKLFQRFTKGFYRRSKIITQNKPHTSLLLRMVQRRQRKISSRPTLVYPRLKQLTAGTAGLGLQPLHKEIAGCVRSSTARKYRNSITTFLRYSNTTLLGGNTNPLTKSYKPGDINVGYQKTQKLTNVHGSPFTSLTLLKDLWLHPEGIKYSLISKEHLEAQWSTSNTNILNLQNQLRSYYFTGTLSK